MEGDGQRVPGGRSRALRAHVSSIQGRDGLQEPQPGGVPEQRLTNRGLSGLSPRLIRIRPLSGHLAAQFPDLIHAALGEYYLHVDGDAELLFTDNETNVRRLYGGEGAPGFFKDAFHEAVVHDAEVPPSRQPMACVGDGHAVLLRHGSIDDLP